MATLALGFLLGWVFLSAAVPKLLLAREFEDAVANYELLPPELVRPVSKVVPWLELLIAGGFFFGAARVAGGIAALILLAFAVAVGANLLRGRRIECGCVGVAAPRRISWYLVGKDCVLATISTAVTLSPEGLSGSVSSSDAVAVAATAGLIVIGEAVVIEFATALRAVKAFDRTDTIV